MPTMEDTDHNALISEITVDPETIGYSGKNQDEILDLINAPIPTGSTVFGTIDTQECLRLLLSRGKLGALEIATADAPKKLVAVLKDVATLDPGDVQTEVLFTDVVSEGTLVAADAQAVKALAAIVELGPSRAQVLFGCQVAYKNVRQAVEGR